MGRLTTDPGRHDLAWVVRWHPDHGRSVVLYHDDNAVTAYTDYVDGPLLFRSGGYWWDGTTWYRPEQVIDWAGEDYYRRPVPAAATVTAGGILAASAADPGTRDRPRRRRHRPGRPVRGPVG